MAISFVAAGAVATGTNPTVAVPTGYATDDFLVLAVAANAAVTTPAGWTLIGSQITTPRIYLYRKFATSSESSVTVTVASTTAVGVMLAYRGVNTTDTISTGRTATSTTIATNTLTTTYANEYVVSAYAMTIGAATWTAPASTTSRVDSASTAALDGLLIVDELQAAAGVSTARTATSSVSKALGAISFSIYTSDRYWVGGSGTWNTTSTTNWSFSSGGASGAPRPTARDNVVFDQAGTYTVTRTGALTCLDFTVSAGTVTFSSTGTLAISGSLTLLAGTVWSATGANTFNSTSTGRTITTNGVTITGAITFNGVGGGWTLGSALTTSGAFSLTNGTFDTSVSNYAVTAVGTHNTATGATLNLNGSTYTQSAAASYWTVDSGAIINAGTSTISFPNGCILFRGGGKTYNNITVTGYINITDGSNTIGDLTYTFSGGGVIAIGGNTTITTLVASGTSLTSRIQIQGNIFYFAGGFGYRSSTPRTLTVGTWVTKQYIDFRDITAAGASAPWSGTSFGDCGGNSNITFPAPKTVYWNLAGANNSSANGWAATSGGSPATSNYPLAQDTAVIDNSSAGSSIDMVGNIGSISTSSRTSAITLILRSTLYGNLTTGSGITYSYVGGVGFIIAGNSPQTISLNGKNIEAPLTLVSTSTVTLQDAFTSNYGITVVQGTFDANNFSVTATVLNTSIPLTRTVAFGSGTWTLSSNGVVVNANGSLLTVTGSGTISLTSASAKSFLGNGLTYYNINQGGAGALTIIGSNTFNDITNTYNATGATSILFQAGTTSTFTNWNASGASGRLLTIGSSTAASHTLSKASGTVNADFLSISRSNATGGATWNAANSTDGGNNTGWLFGVTYASAFSDTATGSDTFSAAFAFLGSIAETATATDAIDTIATLNSATDETATGTDEITPTYLAYPAVNETANATDSVFGNFAYMVFTAETAAATDEMAGGNGLFAQLSEAVTASDSNVALMVLACQIGETATATDAVRRVTIFVGAIAELATGTDAVRALVRFTARILETTTATDVTLVAPSVYRARVAEAATALEALFPSGVFNVQFVDSATALDAVVGAYLWNPIDDNQTANWQNVNNSQSPTWTDVNNSQTPGWTPVIP
jgi:hypothetical protein